jgi:hypothetical protein
VTQPEGPTCADVRDPDPYYPTPPITLAAGGAAWALWVLTMLGLPVVAWLDHLSRQAGRPELAQFILTSTLVGPVLACVSAATVGAVLASRRPRHPVGWLLLVSGLSIAWSGVPRPMPPTGSWPAPAPSPPPTPLSDTGPSPSSPPRPHSALSRCLPHRQAALAPLALVGPGNSSCRCRLGGGPGGGQGPLDPQYQVLGGPFDLRGQGGVLLVVNQLALAATTLAVLVGAASLVVRFRHAQGMERQRLRWVAWAAALALLGAVVALGGLAVGTVAVVTWAISISLAVLPLAIGAAILRYRLDDLDHIISRTLGYGLLTVLLGGGYAAVVLGLGQRLGRESSLAVARPPWPWPACSSRPAAGSSRRSIAASTAVATTPPRSSRGSRSASGTRWTWTPSTPSCWPWSTRPCSRPRRRCGCGHRKNRHVP